MTVTTRRRFLGSVAAGAASFAAAGVSARELVCGQAPTWDKTVDLLIVGSGYAGLCAAVEAKDAGAKPVIIEKMAILGGNSLLCGGGIAAPGNDLQKKAGIQDSPDQLYADMLKSGGGSSTKSSPASLPTTRFPRTNGCATTSASSSTDSPTTAGTPSRAAPPTRTGTARSS